MATFQRLPFWKKNYLINPRFQLSFIAYNLGVASLLAGVFYGAVRFFFWKLAGFGIAAGLPKTHVFFLFLDQQVALMNMVFLVVFPLVVLLLSLHGILLSHKVAGPLYRLHRHMKQTAAGERPPGPSQFRRGDYFHELSAAYNGQMKKMTDSSKVA
jgi:hypothetical protein